MNVGHIFHAQSGAMVYLALAYAVFFVVIFVYVMALSRRQARVRDDLMLLQRALDEERLKGTSG